MKNVLFGVVGWNIAETTRMIEVANILRSDYTCHFFSYGGQFEHLVEEAGYILHRLNPREDEKKIQHLWKVDRGETFKQPWTLDELTTRINSELALIDQYQPEFAFLGSVLTFSMSCKIRKIKLFNVIPLALSRPYLEAGLPISPFLPRVLNQISTWILLHVPLLVRNFREVAKLYGLTPPRIAFDVWMGDINIVTEVEAFSLLKKLPVNWYFSGPLFAHLKSEIPIEIKNLLTHASLPKVYFAMGSSANRKVLLKTLEAFDGLNVVVVAPIKSHLEASDVIPSNVHVTDWLPALETMKHVDIAVTHGGQGTVQTTLVSGKPFLGIGMQPEQELNIHPFVVYGNALQINKHKVIKKDVQAAIHQLLNESSFHESAQRAKAIIEKIDTANIIRAVVEENIK